jgi:hypothetical protein
MRKKNPLRNFNLLLAALLLVPPVGLLLLWMSPRSRGYKVMVTVATVLFFAALAGVVWVTGYYEELIEPSVPATGFCYDRDHQGHYRIDRVLPLERKIFNEVVREKRRNQAELETSLDQTVDRTSDDPETRAIGTVAERHNLDTTDVQAIFMKVSSKLAPGG